MLKSPKGTSQSIDTGDTLTREVLSIRPNTDEIKVQIFNPLAPIFSPQPTSYVLP